MPAKLIGPEGFTALALFAVVFVTHSLSPSATSGDSRWIVPQMVSLLSEGNLDLNEYPEVLRANKYYAIECVDAGYRVGDADTLLGCPWGSRFYGHFPIGSTAVALPPFLAMDGVLRLAGPPLLRAGTDRLRVLNPLLHDEGTRIPTLIRAFLRRDYVHSYGLVEMVLASFLVGVTAAVVFLTGREFLSRRMAVILALLFAYGTSAWSTASRALWQHGPEMLMLSMALYLLVKGGSRVAWSGMPLALAYFIRPTGAIAAALLGLFVLMHHRRWFSRWAMLAAATALPFLAWNFAVYHRLLQPYFTAQHFLAPEPGNVGPFLAALAGQCFSPSRGLFVFSPFLLFAVWGIRMALRRNWQTPLIYYLAAILLLHWVAISAFADWTAGACFGPRYFCDVLPIFLFFLIPVLASLPAGRVPKWAVAAFALSVAIAAGIHFRGAVSWEAGRWNLPEVTSARVWDWKDPQFLRGLFH